MIDCNALIGPYPYRYLPHPDPEVLVRVLEREGLAGAWVGHDDVAGVHRAGQTPEDPAHWCRHIQEASAVWKNQCLEAQAVR